MAGTLQTFVGAQRALACGCEVLSKKIGRFTKCGMNRVGAFHEVAELGEVRSNIARVRGITQGSLGLK
jgi:hypothetical protein